MTKVLDLLVFSAFNSSCEMKNITQLDKDKRIVPGCLQNTYTQCSIFFVWLEDLTVFDSKSEIC